MGRALISCGREFSKLQAYHDKVHWDRKNLEINRCFQTSIEHWSVCLKDRVISLYS